MVNVLTHRVQNPSPWESALYGVSILALRAGETSMGTWMERGPMARIAKGRARAEQEKTIDRSLYGTLVAIYSCRRASSWAIAVAGGGPCALPVCAMEPGTVK